MITDSVPPQTPQPEPGGVDVPQVRGGARPRWLLPVAGAVVVLAVGIGIVAGVALNAQRTAGTASAAAGYVPANATIYAELRMDLPGDQAANWRTLLGHFPAEASDKLLTAQLDTWLDELTATNGSKLRYTTDVKPWFDGTMAMAMIGYPSMTGAMMGGATQTPDLLVFAGVKDQAAASAAVDRIRAEAGGSPTSTTHGGATIWSIDAGTRSGGSVAWTITADEVVLGTSVDLVATALDVHGGSADDLASRAAFRDGVARLPADRAATVAIDLKAITDRLKADVASAAPSIAPLIDSLGATQAQYMVGSARIEGNRLVMDSSTALAAASTTANHSRGLAELTPSDAFFFADTSAVGSNLSSMIEALKAMAGTAGGTDQLAQIESILGGDLASLVSWIGDAAIVAGAPAGTPYVGLIITPTDAAAARTRLLQLQGLLTLSAAGGGPSVTVSEADHNGTKITTLTFADVPTELSFAGAIQYAVTNDRVVIGSGTSFVSRVLDMTGADSLASEQRFSQGLSAVGGGSNLSTMWLDLDAIRTAVESILPAEARSAYETQARQWLLPFDYLISASRADGDRQEARAVVAVK